MIIITYGAQSAAVGTKHQLHSTTESGVYELLVDTTGMVNGDKLELYVEVRYKAGGALVQTHYATFSHAQADPGKVSVPVVAPYGAAFYLQQTAGTAQGFDWCITSG